MNQIVLRYISKSYYQGDKVNTVLNTGGELIIPLEGVVAVIGESGAGKSTLLNIISLLDFPDIQYAHNKEKTPAIEYLINGHRYCITYTSKFFGKLKFNIKHIRSDGEKTTMDVESFRQQVINVIFQEQRLQPNLNIELNLKSPHFAAKNTLDDKTLIEAGKFIGIDDKLSKFPSILSGGERQRTAILRSLLRETPVIFADEMTNNLDYYNSVKILNEIISSLETEATPLLCFIWVCHDLHWVEEYADSIVFVKKDGATRVVDKSEEHDVIKLQELVRNNDEPEPFPNNHIRPEVNQASFCELIEYYSTYAKRDVFKRGLIPHLDAAVLMALLFLLVIFMMSMLKFGLGSLQYIEQQLSDPKINHLKVVAKEKLTLNNHFVKLQAQLKNVGCGTESTSKCFIAPVFQTQVYIKEKGNRNREYALLAHTFRPDSPVIKTIVENNNLQVQAYAEDSFIYSDETVGLFIVNSEFEHAGYELNDHIYISHFAFNKIPPYQKTVPFLVESQLPADVDILIREKFFLDTYRSEKEDANETQNNTVDLGNIEVAYFEVFPASINDVYTIESLVKKIGLEFEGDFELKAKMVILEQLKAKVELIAYFILFAIGILAFCAITISTFYSIGKKSKELGIDISNGMRTGQFVLFYICKSLILFFCSCVAALGLYWWFISDWIGNKITETELGKAIAGEISAVSKFDTQMVGSITLPYCYYAVIVGGVWILLIASYLLSVYLYSQRTPKALLGEE